MSNRMVMRLALCACVCLLPAVLAAQTAPAPVRPWRAGLRVTGAARASDNVFLLTDGGKERVSERPGADVASGRITDMKAASDVVLAAEARVSLSGPGLGGRNLALDADVGYDAYLRNSRRSHVVLGADVAQSLGHGRQLRVGASLRPSYFHKNYLTDAVDTNGDNLIDVGERLYTAGTSAELDVAVAYRHRIRKAAVAGQADATAEVRVGYLDRRYDAPFAGRSRSGPALGMRLGLGVGPRWTLALKYAFAAVGSDVSTAVLLLDETVIGQDVNGSGSASDTSARAVVPVDVSRVEHEVSASLEGRVTPATTVQFGAARRVRRFGSDQALDIVHRDRRDARLALRVDVDVRLRPGVRLALGLRRAAQSTNRAGDPASSGDVADYTRHVLSVGLRYRL